MNMLSIIANNVVMTMANPTQAAYNLVKRIERGDADSSGSTIRTGFVVALVVALMGVITLAVLGLGNRVGAALDNINP
jgi:hypothetical protein